MQHDYVSVKYGLTKYNHLIKEKNNEFISIISR